MELSFHCWLPSNWQSAQSRVCPRPVILESKQGLGEAVRSSEAIYLPVAQMIWNYLSLVPRSLDPKLCDAEKK